MKTQCPHCHAKFNTPDNNKGKKAKCNRCNQPFVIKPFSETPAPKRCRYCHQELTEPQRASHLGEGTVCTECAKKLRQRPKEVTTQEREAAREEEQGALAAPQAPTSDSQTKQSSVAINIASAGSVFLFVTIAVVLGPAGIALGIGALVLLLPNALLLQIFTNWVCHFKPAYFTAYKACFIALTLQLVTGACLGMLMAGILGEETSPVLCAIITMPAGFVITAAIFGDLIKHPEKGPIGFVKACLVILLWLIVCSAIAGSFALLGLFFL